MKVEFRRPIFSGLLGRYGFLERRWRLGVVLLPTPAAGGTGMEGDIVNCIGLLLASGVLSESRLICLEECSSAGVIVASDFSLDYAVFQIRFVVARAYLHCISPNSWVNHHRTSNLRQPCPRFGRHSHTSATTRPLASTAQHLAADGTTNHVFPERGQ